jgi:hypothetical protein
VTSYEIAELDEQMEIVAGRKAPLTMIPDWVTLYAGSKSAPNYQGHILSPQAKAIYNVLAMHVNVQKGDDACWPSRKTIATMLGFTREQSVDPYLDQLDEVDAIDREPMTRPNGAKGVRYIVHQTPPPGYTGDQSVGEYYARRRKELAAEPTRKPGRPRKEKPGPAPDAAGQDAETQEQALDTVAQLVADEWWERAQGHLTPLVSDKQKEKARTNLVARIRDALAAGHDLNLIKLALQETGEWGPAKARFERTLKNFKGKSPEDIALDKRAQLGATTWWERAEELVAAKRMRVLMVDSERQRSGYFLNLRTRIRAALAAGYDSRVIMRALEELGEWSPAKREFDRALGRLSGVRQPKAGSGRAPLFTNDQWKEAPAKSSTPDTPAASAPAPDLSVFGVQSDDAA